MENTEKSAKVENVGGSSAEMTTSAKKHSKLVRRRPYVVAIVVLTVLMLVGAGFGVYGMVTRGQVDDKAVTEEKAEIVDEAGETMTVVAEKDGEKEEQVKTLLADLADQIPDWFDIKNEVGNKLPPEIVKVYDMTDGFPIAYQPEGMKIAVPLERYYGLSVGPNAWGSTEMPHRDEFIDVILSDLPGRIETWLKERGFKQRDGRLEFMNDDGMICALGGSYPGAAISCSWTTWFDAKTAEFSNRVALESGFPEGNTLSLDPDNLDIKDSKNSPYQTMTGGVIGAVGLWYRVSPDAPWQWFRATQMALECEEYNTDDLKKAYEGEVCVEGQELSEVRL